MTITTADMRKEVAGFLERIGCRITPSFFDRREGSYSVGRIGQDDYFLPTTWPREEYVLDWVYGHREQVRRGILGEPVEFALFKTESAGAEVKLVDPRGTSQTCPACGTIKAKTLSERRHRCPCGANLDRDVAAAMVVHQRAYRNGPGHGLRCTSQRVAA